MRRIGFNSKQEQVDNQEALALITILASLKKLPLADRETVVAMISDGMDEFECLEFVQQAMQP